MSVDYYTPEQLEREESGLIDTFAEAFREALSTNQDIQEAECDALAAMFVPMLIESWDNTAIDVDRASSPIYASKDDEVAAVLDAMNQDGSFGLDADSLSCVQTHLIAKDVIRRCEQFVEMRSNLIAIPQVDQEVLVSTSLGTEEIFMEGIVVEVKEKTAVVQLVGFHREEFPFEDLTLVTSDEDEEGVGQGACEICKRETRLTRHHLIPRETHTSYRRRGYTREVLNTTAKICRSCHSMVHRIASNNTLAANYNTIEKLFTHPKIQRWAEYASKQSRLGK